MKLYLNTTGGVGYDFVLNHTSQKNGKTTLARVNAKGESLAATDIADLTYRVEGNVIKFVVPRAAIGLDHADFTLWFKVADSTEAYTTIEDFYDKGDAAPLGRLNYVYRGA